MEEIYKDVVGYEDLFSVSNFGNVYSKRTNKILKQYTTKAGYKTIATKIGGKLGISLCFKVHRLVAEAHLPPPSENLLDGAKLTVNEVVLVNHKDGDKTNNTYTNLEWCNSSHNANHAISLGLISFKRSFENITSKLSPEEVSFIRKSYVPYDRVFGSRSLGRKFGVSHSVISNVVNNVKYI